MWQNICDIKDLRSNCGIGALINGVQIAIFYLPKTEQKWFAVDNWDPLGKAFVLSRGIVGDVKGRPVVASPLYKQHFDLQNGVCLEEPETSIQIWPIEIRNNQVWVNI